MLWGKPETIRLGAALEATLLFHLSLTLLPRMQPVGVEPTFFRSQGGRDGPCYATAAYESDGI